MSRTSRILIWTVVVAAAVFGAAYYGFLWPDRAISESSRVELTPTDEGTISEKQPSLPMRQAARERLVDHGSATAPDAAAGSRERVDSSSARGRGASATTTDPIRSPLDDDPVGRDDRRGDVEHRNAVAREPVTLRRDPSPPGDSPVGRSGSEASSDPSIAGDGFPVDRPAYVAGQGSGSGNAVGDESTLPRPTAPRSDARDRADTVLNDEPVHDTVTDPDSPGRTGREYSDEFELTEPAPDPEDRDEPEPPTAPGVPVVSMVADAAEAPIGSVITIRVAISGATDVGSVPFHVTFDPGVLQFVQGFEGPFLSSDGRQTAFFAAPTTGADTVVVGLSRLGRGDGIVGDGVLCELVFSAVGPGDAGLDFRRAKVRDSENRIVPAEFRSSVVRVDG